MASICDLARELTRQTAEMLCKDAAHIPAEKLGWSPGESGKSAIKILTECASTNLEMAAAVGGGSPGGVEEGLDFAALRAAVMESAEAVCRAIDSLSEADLDKELTLPWGMKMPFAQAILLPSSHMGYHDGQVNYIQLLLGDTKFHWIEDK